MARFIPKGLRKKAPWREGPSFSFEDRTSLLSEVIEYSPIHGKKVKTKFYNILLVGMAKVGKSSWCSTVDSALHGRITNRAPVANAPRGFTEEYNQYRFYDKDGKRLQFRVCDTVGLDTSADVDKDTLALVLDGAFRCGDQHTLTENVATSYAASDDDKVHVVCLVIDGSTVGVLGGDTLHNLQRVIKQAGQKGIPLMIIVTKVDKVMEGGKLRKIFSDERVRRIIEEVSQKFGIRKSYIWPVKNYNEETKVDEVVDILALSTLKIMIQMANDGLAMQLDQS